MISAWNKGVDQYAKELKREFRENYGRQKITEDKLLNGAKDWKEYSYGGMSLIYNDDIAGRLANPSELKKARGKSGYVGSMANKNESWLDVQARALYQASRKIIEHELRGRK